MSNARKLQTEIERTMKKIDEGVELFDDIWEKVYSAEQQNQKEKFEMDLKKEIKKLQRHRDQIKTWISGSEVKDKEPLIEARKLIESKMEQFKICEKETKTKTYSKEGLAREDKLDPEDEAKLNTTSWLGEYIEKMTVQVEEKDFEIEKLSTGKGKKNQKHKIEALQKYVLQHKFHMSKLEGIIRLVNNDRLPVDIVDPLQDDLDYYLESYEDEDYAAAYDEEYFYESLGLEELDVVNVDRLTQLTMKKADDATSTSSKSSKERKGSKKSALSSVIPLTIGRARSTKDKLLEEKLTPVKIGRVSSTASSTTSKPELTPPPKPLSGTPPATTPTATPSQPGTSMAAILKRESEQQEKERQQKLQREQQARAQAEQLRLQQQRQQEQLRQQEALRLQQAQAAAQQEALLRQQQEAKLAQQLKEAAQKQAQQAAAEQQALQNQQLQPQAKLQSGSTNAMDVLTSGLGDLSVGSNAIRADAIKGPSTSSPIATQAGLETGSSYLSALNDSFAVAPANTDNERSRTYAPQNPYPTPSTYPATPSAIFENPEIFEKLGTDALFFIFYYSQGTYQQYLAARELKKQSWRFHKKYMTWFQRHEEPKVTTDEYEQGTYVYFDYETGWCTRIKPDFRFEYAYLEDSLQ